MKKVNAIFYFPYNWYQLRTVKIRNNSTKLLGKIKFAEETKLEIAQETESLNFQIDFYKAKLSALHNHSYIVVYLDTRSFFGFVNPKKLKVKLFKTYEERNDFCNSLYLNLNKKTKPVKQKNKANLILGILISLILTLSPFYVQQGQLGGDDVNIVFMSGLISLISLIILNYEKSLQLSSYKTRIYATVAAFVLSLLFLSSKTLITIVSLMTIIFFVRYHVEFKKLNASN